jgi:hypothetical protein
MWRFKNKKFTERWMWFEMENDVLTDSQFYESMREDDIQSQEPKDSTQSRKSKVLTCAPLEELVEMAKTAKEPEFLKNKFKGAVLPDIDTKFDEEEWTDAPIPGCVLEILGAHPEHIDDDYEFKEEMTQEQFIKKVVNLKSDRYLEQLRSEYPDQTEDELKDTQRIIANSFEMSWVN